MRCAIMQPTYLPWSGYFNLIASVDTFIFLDDAQLQKHSWHSRNRILLNNQPHWITVPVRHNSLAQLLTETQLLDEKKWRRKHASTLLQSYARHPFKDVVNEITTLIEQNNETDIASLNIRLICFIARKLGINTQIRLASQILVDGQRTERILNILRKIRATDYLSPIGAAGYLENDRFTEQQDIKLSFQEFTPIPYIQSGMKSFIPYLSIVDILANLGWDATATYIQNSKHLRVIYE